MKTKERMAETLRHPIFIDFVGSHFATKKFMPCNGPAEKHPLLS